MALITRFSRLFTADLHALLDRLESPDVLLNQAIREMEDALAVREARIQRTDLEGEQAARQLASVDRSLREIAAQLDVCFAANDEALARPLLKRQLELERLAERVRARREHCGHTAAAERARCEGERRELDSLRQQAEVMLQTHEATPAAVAAAAFEAPVTAADVEVALLRERQRRRQS